jgi:glycosyltransferase involved in cell wall biosynthesis
MSDSPGRNENTGESLRRFSLVAVIPAYNVESEIESVLNNIPDFMRHVIVVDDASSDATSAIVRRAGTRDSRIILLPHETNQGVGGAMRTGFRKALELRAQIVVKIDGDGQMCTSHLPDLLWPLIRGDADYTKGNRFRDFRALRQMPYLRRAGNMALSFCTKAASGYWNCFDPTNGFVAIRGSVLAQLPLEKIHRSYFFETSMLSQLYLLGAVVKDIPIPARYGMETSNLSIKRVLSEFPGRLLAAFGRRLILKNFIYDFTMESIYLLCGVPLVLTGVIYGTYNWIHYARLGHGAPTGTIMITALLLTFGFQILLAAVGIDLQSTPREPLSRELAADQPEVGESKRFAVPQELIPLESEAGLTTSSLNPART